MTWNNPRRKEHKEKEKRIQVELCENDLLSEELKAKSNYSLSVKRRAFKVCYIKLISERNVHRNVDVTECALDYSVSFLARKSDKGFE